MAGPKRTRGFTLVELLVVITIIGMLVSLLLPAIQTAREAGRKNTCQNNMRNCGLALGNFETTKRYFPGYANVIGGKRASWIVPILPYLERNDLYQSWQNPGATWNDGQHTFFSPMAVLVCPSNPAPATGLNALSFVVNTGLAGSATDNLPSPQPTATMAATSVSNQRLDDVNSGVFFNQSLGDPAATPPTTRAGKKTTMDFLNTNDGSTYTLMLSENLQATNWATDPTDTSGTNPQYLSDFALRQNTGFVWYITGIQNNTGPPLSSTSGYDPNGIQINAQAKVLVGTPALPYTTPGTNPQGLAYVRPSSNHPGGVNTFFCGGNARFLAEDIGYNVYTQLMTSNQNGVMLTVPPAAVTTPLTTTATMHWNYTLDESQF